MTIKGQSIGVVLTIVALDFAGIGLILPIIPRLLSEVAHTSDLGWRFGAFSSLYALMQFIFSPGLDRRGGALSGDGAGSIQSARQSLACAKHLKGAARHGLVGLFRQSIGGRGIQRGACA
jgi:hypothetical protein